MTMQIVQQIIIRFVIVLVKKQKNIRILGLKTGWFGFLNCQVYVDFKGALKHFQLLVDFKGALKHFLKLEGTSMKKK